ncbi:MAG: SlyX family protein [Deltaproteobacteria bacterium]|jgi:SlyX protein|nr:SlyX family protein [Deltaproteobacteria bacterium]
MDERVVELEVRIAYQDKLIADLDEVIRTFARRVEVLERRVDELSDSLHADPVGPADEPPPHY